MRRFSQLRRVLVLAFLGCTLLIHGAALAHICWTYSTTVPAELPLPWVGGCDGVVDPGAQLLHHEHRNWHCTNPSANTVAWGQAFVGFHRQFILDFDIWRETFGIERLQTWDSAPNEPIPGNEEEYTIGFTHCFNAAGTVDDGTSRPAGAPCVGCISLPADLVGDSNLDDYTSLGAVGARLESSGWHNAFHNGALAAGGACDDIGTFLGAPHDPAFWMGHKKLDAIARDWQRLVAADIVIVLDRSGSMDDNCPGGIAVPGATPCKLNDAVEAARLFADLIQDDRPGSADEHMVGLVSFSTNATSHLGGALVPAAGIVTDNGLDETAFEAALAGIAAGGSTSIGDGLRAAKDILAGGTSPHQAILLLTDGAENEAEFISTVRDELGEIQVCAIGFGTLFADDEDQLRSVCEQQGGIFVADDDLLEDGISLEKFFVDCFGQIYDEAIAEDPLGVLPAGQVATLPVVGQVCGSDERSTCVLGFDRAMPACSLRIVVETPAGALVDVRDAGLEPGTGDSWNHLRIPLPYRGEQVGMWKCYGVRPQRVFVHGFTTDAFANPAVGTRLVRSEIHRLLGPGGNDLQRVLYYEDGSLSGRSAYNDALQAELARGVIGMLTTAVSPLDFNTKLMQNWDLIVFARQVNPTAQPFDTGLRNKICAGQRALLTDFYAPAAGPNPILLCAGVTVSGPDNYNVLVGDGRLVPTAGIPLSNPGYLMYSRTLTPTTGGAPSLIQARNEVGTGSIVGTGSQCEGGQSYFLSTLTRGFGRVEASPVRQRFLLGQRILATFRMTESNRPIGDWDAVSATVSLDRPGAGPLEVYTLYDDGTNGDMHPGNNYWEVEIPIPVATTGPHVLSAQFKLTKGGCTIQREATYSVVAHRDPQNCKRTYCSPPRVGRPGQILTLLSCIRNLCVSRDSFEVTITDQRGWLCTVNQNGTPTPVSSLVHRTAGVDGGRSVCLPEEVPLRVCVPVSAAAPDSDVVTYRYRSLGHTGQADSTCTMIVRVGPPGPLDVTDGAPLAFAVRVTPNPARDAVHFALALPEAAQVALKIYDVSGRLIGSLADRGYPAGAHSLTWSVRDGLGPVRPGIYFYRLSAGDREARGPVILLH